MGNEAIVIIGYEKRKCMKEEKGRKENIKMGRKWNDRTKKWEESKSVDKEHMGLV